AIQRQFHHLVRIVPGNGLLVVNANDGNLAEVLAMGSWTPEETVSVGNFPARWQAGLLASDGSRFSVLLDGKSQGDVSWTQLGEHNVHNALSAIAAARHAGVPVVQSIEALGEFSGVKRRLEVRGEVAGITVYDDFAHHPTAIATTLQGLRQHADGRLLAIFEPRSNTMRMGVHRESLAEALSAADAVWLFEPDNLGWDLSEVSAQVRAPVNVAGDIDVLVNSVIATVQPGDRLIVMSNGSFDDVHNKLLAALGERYA
ncbi:UDP-N-acetylmuramate:L-alanyl-gamma-D-glutamyl-meso-diaminopimelate ligase, partial [hydrothermal vent metagenome]